MATKESLIRLEMPMDLVKSDNDGEMRIAGRASTQTADRQGDTIIQKGLDIAPFIENGFFNFDHDNTKILGWPDGDKCRVEPDGLYVEGTLLKGVPEAERVYQTAIALQKSGAPRRLGFSVEGKILDRDADGFIRKAIVYNVAITANPVNPRCTWDVLAKSFAAADTMGDAPAGLRAGNTEETASPLIKESLEGALKILSHTIGSNQKAKGALKTLQEALMGRGNLTKSEMTLYFMLTRGMAKNESASLVEQLFS